MSSKSKKPPKKGGGRVTAKGTKPAPKKSSARNVVPTTPDPFDERSSSKVHESQGRIARPITHNRGNR